MSGQGKDTTYESRILSSLYNPFSIKNLEPKWPDGLCNTSVGMQFRQTTEVKGSELLIVLFPGLTNWMVAYQWDELNDKYWIRANHGDRRHCFSVVESQYQMKFSIGAAGTDAVQTYVPEFSSWRPVSVGLRMMNVNTDNDNDGWFECVRTSRSTFLNRMGIVMYGEDAPVPPTTTSFDPATTYIKVGMREKDNIFIKPGMIMPLTSLAQEWYSARNWAIMPSYASGKLRELKDFVFQLNPEKRHNYFIPMVFTAFKYPESLTAQFAENVGINVKYVNYDVPGRMDQMYELTNNQWFVAGMTTENQDTNAGSDATQWVDFQKGFSSENFDVILIKIHGLENTRTVLSTCCNLELQRNELHNKRDHGVTNSYACIDSLDRYIENRITRHRNPFSDVTNKQ